MDLGHLRPNTWSYRVKVPLLITAVSVMTALAVSLAIAVTARHWLREDLHDHASAVAQSLARGLVVHIARDDVWEAFEAVRAVAAGQIPRDGFGDLSHDGSEHRNVRLDDFEPLAGVLLHERGESLPECSARLRIGGEQPRKIGDRPFEPGLGAAAQRPFDDGDRDRHEAESRDECLDRAECQAEIRGDADGNAREGNEDVDQALHARSAAKQIRRSPHSIARRQREANRSNPLFTLFVNNRRRSILRDRQQCLQSRRTVRTQPAFF